MEELTAVIQQRRGLKKVGRAGSCNFPRDRCKFPTEEILGAQNVKFSHKFLQNVLAQILAFLDVNFSTTRKKIWTVYRQPKIWQGATLPPLPQRS